MISTLLTFLYDPLLVELWEKFIIYLPQGNFFSSIPPVNNPGGNPSPVRRMEITNPFYWKSRFR